VGQYFGIGLGGAIVLTVIALATFLTTDSLIVLMGGKRGQILPFVPPLLLLVIWNQYTLRLGDLIGLLAALLSVRLYLRLPDTFVRRVAFVALLAGVYYAAGGAFILLVALCAFYELCAKGRMGLALAYVVIGTLLPGVMGEQLFGAELWQTSGGLTGEAMTGAKASVAAWVGLHAFYGLLTVGVVFGTTLRRVQERLAARTGRPVGVKRMGRILMAARPFLLLVVTVGVAFKTHDYKTGTFRRFSYAAQNHMWLAVVEIGRGDPDIFTPYVCRMVNRALYETGRLSSEMFAFPQLPEGGLLPTLALAQPYKSDTLLELGAVNRAEHLALESKEIWGPRPFVVRLLARIALVKGDPSARIWLNMLSKDILFGRSCRSAVASKRPPRACCWACSKGARPIGWRSSI
ncbi:MAG: DUF6057 family protein, partial [Planctomycetota bacterium]